jgi:branched-chain amino acid transport system substrate-binding protein
MRRRLLVLILLIPIIYGCEKDNTVHFGAVLPLTGPYSVYGQSIQKGVTLKFEEIAAREDFPYKLALTVVDSQSDPELAKQLLAEQFSGDALAVVGGVTTDEALAMVPVADRYDQVLISPSASSPELTGISKNFYRLFPSDATEGRAMASFATGELGVKKVVILAKEDVYAKGIKEVFKSQIESEEGEILDLIEFPEGAEVSGLVDRVMTLEPDGVYLAAYAKDIGDMIKELRRKNFKGTIFTTSAFSAPEVIEQVGKPAEGVYLTQAAFEVESEDPLVEQFVSTYRAKYGLAPDLYAAHGYDAVIALIESLQKTGPLKSDFRKGLKALLEVPGVTGPIQFDEKGGVSKFPHVYVVRNGNLVDFKGVVQTEREELLRKLRELQDAKRRAALAARDN